MRRGARTGAIWRQISTSVRAADITSEWAPTIASLRSPTASSSRSVRSHVERSLGWSDKKSYPAKLKGDRERSGLSESVVCGLATIGGFPVALGVMDFHFRGGTMGQVTGERITLLLEEARRRKIPCIIFAASGGARMEEGMLALMQMAKTTAAVTRFMEDGNFFVVVLTDPTTGGVAASFAFQADVIVAESKAVIGFAGRRVIEQTIRQRLPDQFQTAEFLLEKGAIDMVVDRRKF